MTALQRIKRSLRVRHGRTYVREANLLRDRGDWIEAAIVYRRALDWMPWRDDLHVQVGNCFKEYGDYEAATRSYRRALSGDHSFEAFGQLEDVNRRRGRPVLLASASADDDPIAARQPSTAPASISVRDFPNRIRIETLEPRRSLGTLGRAGSGSSLRWSGLGNRIGNRPLSISFEQVGNLSILRDGLPEPLFTGVVAVRLSVAGRPREWIELCLGEGGTMSIIAREPLRSANGGDGAADVQVANIWLDAGHLPPGRHWLSARVDGAAASTGLHVTVIAPSMDRLHLAETDAYVPSPSSDVQDLSSSVVSDAARVRPASRTLFDGPIQSILVIRADQLGDVATSLPAIARLRTLFPAARMTVLVQPSVAAVIEASGLADEVLTISLSYDATSERRYLEPAEERRIRDLCSARVFDLAVDLCPGEELRPLLLLTGAKYLVGFGADRFSFLDYGITVRSRDKANQLNAVSHAAVVMTLVEGLAIATSTRSAVPRLSQDPTRAVSKHGLAPKEYIVLHTGARHAINMWPSDKFCELAALFINQTSLTLVVFSPDNPLFDRLSAGTDRLRILGSVDNDDFDEILSAACLLIGNDSGPKHLASVRGVPTVSLHVNRLNWNEWGQDGEGVILSKRVPCAGCGLNDINRCGRDAVCLRSIRVDEVFAAALPLLPQRFLQSASDADRMQLSPIQPTDR